MELKRMGWRHFEFIAPADWDIVAEGSSRGVAFFRVSDKYRPRLEVRWEKVPFEKAVGPEEMLKLFKEEWGRRLKEYRKRGIEAELKHVYKEEISVRGHGGLTWAFRVGGEAALAALWYCEKSERAVTLVYTPERLDEGLPFFRRLLKSFRCHYDSPGERALWSLLLLDVYLPQSYRLAAARFTAALSYAVFKRPEEYVYLLIGYSGLASAILPRYKRGVRGWFEKTLKKELSSSLRAPLPKLKYGEVERGGLEFRGESFAIPRSKRRVFSGKVWLDERLNRVLAVAAFYELRYEGEAVKVLGDVLRQLAGPTHSSVTAPT